jgi:hypothetical protein
LVARRIVPFVREKQDVTAGQRIAVRFGSRVDVYLPEAMTHWSPKARARSRGNRARRPAWGGCNAQIQRKLKENAHFPATMESSQASAHIET